MSDPRCKPLRDDPVLTAKAWAACPSGLDVAVSLDDQGQVFVSLDGCFPLAELQALVPALEAEINARLESLFGLLSGKPVVRNSRGDAVVMNLTDPPSETPS